MEKIVEYLKKNKKATAKEIAEAINIPTKEVKKSLKFDIFKRDDNYRYSLINYYQIIAKGENDTGWLLVETVFDDPNLALKWAKNNFQFSDGEYEMKIIKICTEKSFTITRTIKRDFSD